MRQRHLRHVRSQSKVQQEADTKEVDVIHQPSRANLEGKNTRKGREDGVDLNTLE